MLDAIHELQSPACHDVFEMVIAAIPMGSQLAAASRSEQPHLPWLRAAGEAMGFGAADLALDAAGARQIFANVQVSLTPEQAAFAVGQEPAWGSWRAEALWLLGEAHLLAGNLPEARSLLAEAPTVAATMFNADAIVICESELAMLAMDRGKWPEAAGRLERALATIDEYRMHDYVCCLLAFAEAARLSVHRGDLNGAHRQIARAMRARPSATYVFPFVAVRLRLQLAKVYLAIADPATARQLLRETDDILSRRRELDTLTGEAEELRRVLASSTATTAGAARLPLTPAELRLLPYLQTHLTAGEIAEGLFVSSHTVNAQVKSIYRKLGVSSRHDAVQKAAAIGLLGD